mmetsp:Transcript_31132/g.66859  ORF Transcript_31132/g.66859 Transcript_31132/m.66859 type:complete len:185 (-) Transcript_31132:219-773(-)
MPAPEHLRHRRLHWPDDGLSSFLRSHHLKLGTNIFTRNIRVVMLHVMLRTSSNTLGTYNIEDSSFEHRISEVCQVSTRQSRRLRLIVMQVSSMLLANHLRLTIALETSAPAARSPGTATEGTCNSEWRPLAGVLFVWLHVELLTFLCLARDNKTALQMTAKRAASVTVLARPQLPRTCRLGDVT